MVANYTNKLATYINYNIGSFITQYPTKSSINTLKIFNNENTL